MDGECPTIVIIKRNGADGARFPLRRKECLFGRNASCDLRVQLPGVALEHAKVYSSENNEFYLENLTDSETKVNGKLISEKIELNNMDVFSISERSFRFECSQLEATRAKLASMSPGKAAKSPKKVSKSPKRLSRTPTKHTVVSQPSGESQILQTSPLQEANTNIVKDSPRTPKQKRSSLRESLGILRRSSVPFEEVDETSPSSSETKENDQVYVVQSIVDKSPKTTSFITTPKSSKKNKNKRVSFGPMLSPEQFDKFLPVTTPVRKGGTPRRLSAPLAKPCISPARRRYSVATPSFVSRIDEVEEKSDSDEESEEDELETNSRAETADEASPTERRKKMITPLRKEIEQGKELRGRHKKMPTPLKSAIKQGFRLRATKKRLQTPVRKEIEAGVALRQTKKKMATPLRQAIEAKPSLRATKKKMPTPVREAIKSGPTLKATKKVMAKDLQDQIVKGVTLKKRKRLATPVRQAIEAKPSLRATRKRMPTPVRKEIEKKPLLKATKRVMARELQDEIVKGVTLRQKRKLATPLREAIEAKPSLRATRKRMPTPVRKAIERKPSLKATKKVMAKDLQDEIKKGTTLKPTKKVASELAKKLATPVRREICKGVQLRVTKRRMPTLLQDEIKAGTAKLTATKKSLKTPLRKQIESGIRLKETKKKLATPVRKEITKGVELKKAKKSLKTPLRKEIESGVQLKETTKTPKRRHSSTAEPVSSKKLKTPNASARRSGFFPSAKSRRSVARRKSTKQVAPSYAEILKRPKLTAKRRLTGKVEKMYKFEAEQQVDKQTGVNSSRKAKATTPKTKKALRSKTPTPKRQAANVKVPDVSKKNDDWQVVVNKRKIMRIKRQRAAKSQKVNVDMSGIETLFKTPKNVRVQPKRNASPAVEKPKMKTATSSDENNLYGISRLMKTPKVKVSSEENLEGVADLFEVLEMASPIPVSKTPSLRKTSEQVTISSALVVTSTPCLRKKSDNFEVLAPLSTSKGTPSLRKPSETVTIMSPLLAKSTPSLKKSTSVERLTVESPLHETKTPSLRKPATNIHVQSSEKKEPEGVVVELPEVPVEVKPSTRATRSKRKAVTKDFPQEKRPRLSTAKKNESVVTPTKTEIPPIEPTTKATVDEPKVTRSTRGKKNAPKTTSSSPTKYEVKTEPVIQLKSTRSTRSQKAAENNAKKADEKAEIVTEPVKKVTRSTIANKNNSNKNTAETKPAPPTQSTRSTRLNNTKKSNEITKEADQGTDEVEEKIELTEPATKPTRSTRSQRNTSSKQVEDKPEVVKQCGSLRKEPLKETPTKPVETKRSTRGRGKLAVAVEIVPEVNLNTRGKMTRGAASKKNEKTHSKASIPVEDVQEHKDTQAVLLIEDKPRTRRGKTEDIQKSTKRSTRGSQRKSGTASPDQEPSVTQAISHTPKSSTRRGKNVTGIPETPQPMVFAKTKLEPIIEVPTPASSLRGSSVKRLPSRGSKIPDTVESAAPSKRGTRSKRTITTVVEEVEEVKPAAKRRKTTSVAEVTTEVAETVVVFSARSSRSKSAKVKNDNTVEIPVDNVKERSSRKRDEGDVEVLSAKRVRRAVTSKKASTKSNDSVVAHSKTNGKTTKAVIKTQSKRVLRKDEKPASPAKRVTRSRRAK